MLFGHFSTGAVFPVNSIEGDMRALVFTLWSEEFSSVCVCVCVHRLLPGLST